MLKRILGFLLIVALTAALLVVGERGAPADEENAAGLRAVQDKTTVSILDGNRPVLRYRYQGVAFKPYVDQLFSPAGVQILRDSAPDHKHHHGLMYALSVDGVNFWEEATVEAGTERHRRIDTARYFAPDSVWSAGLVEDIDWVASTSDKPLLVERRQIDVLEDQGLRRPGSRRHAGPLALPPRRAAGQGVDDPDRPPLLRPRHAVRPLDGQGRPVLQCR